MNKVYVLFWQHVVIFCVVMNHLELNRTKTLTIINSIYFQACVQSVANWWKGIGSSRGTLWTRESITAGSVLCLDILFIWITRQFCSLSRSSVHLDYQTVLVSVWTSCSSGPQTCIHAKAHWNPRQPACTLYHNKMCPLHTVTPE